MIDRALYRRACALFDSIVELPEDQRAAALADARREDPAAADFAATLLHHDQGSGLLTLSSPAVDPSTMLGSVVDDYVLQSFLGRGGMGAVYVGERREPEVRVAIKFVTLSRAPAEAIERFRRETEVLAALDHPHIVGYRSSGVDDAGRPYLVMDLVDGETLRPQIQELAQSVDATVALAIQLAEATHHFHQRGVVHRDLKPNNVLVTRDDDGTLAPIVIDFGIARSFARTADAELTGTIGFGPVGTPAYMPPELRSAETEASPDVRSDVYSLGAVLLELLTGRGPDLESGPSAAADVDPDVFGTAQSRQRTRNIDRDLEAIVSKALATRPDDRYGSAEALATDLQRWRSGRPITARTIGPAGRFKRLIQRRPLESLSIAAVAVALVATVVITSMSLAKERQTHARLINSLELNSAINDFLFEEVVARVVPTLDGPEVKLLSVLEAAFEARAPRTDHASRAISLSLGLTLQKVYRLLGRSEDADAIFERLIPIAAQVPAGSPSRVQFDMLRASDAAGRGDFETLERLSRAVWQQLQTPDAQVRDADAKLRGYRAGAAQQIATALEAQGDLPGAIEWLKTAAAQQAKNPRIELTLLQTRAFIEQKLGQTERAVATMEAAIQATDGDPKSQIYAPVLNANITNWLNIDGQHARAATYGERAVTDGERVYPDPTHPYHLNALENLSTAYAGSGRLPEAITRRREAVKGTESRYGAASAETAVAHIALAQLLKQSRHDDEEALSLVGKALETLSAAGATHGAALAAARELQAELRASSR